MGKKEKISINEGHFLELMDRLFVATDSISFYCLKHPLAQKEKRLKKKISKALDYLFDAYQMIGVIEDEYEEAKKQGKAQTQ
jgi:hypothetical protein